jgi:predicted phosphodiesterase
MGELTPWHVTRFFPCAQLIKARLSGINNIKIVSNEYDDEIIVGDICGHTVFGVHGDADKVNNVVQNLTLMIRKFPDAIVMGHMHHEMKDTVQGIEVIMSDSLCGVDSYAKKIRKIGNAGQTFIIFNRDQRECTYNIKVV